MRHRSNSKLERSQESVFYVPGASPKGETDSSTRTKYINEFYPHMFIEDVKLGIMPIGVWADRKTFKVSIDPPSSKVEKIIAKALASGEYYQSLASAVRDFVAQCAVELLIFDTTTYEIVYLSEPKSGKAVEFEFVHINPLTLVRRGKELLQRIPIELATKLNKAEYIRLTPERLLTFRLPHSIRGKTEQLIESLGRLSTPTVPEFFMEELTSGIRKTSYDVKAHNYMRSLALARTTNLVGWNARRLFEKEALEYYLIHRALLFEEFKIELRNTILKSLNEGVKRSSRLIGFTAEIVVTDLPTLSDVQTARQYLQEGKATFKEILEPFTGF